MTVTLVNTNKLTTIHVQHFSQEIDSSYTTYIDNSLTHRTPISPVILPEDLDKARILSSLTNLYSPFLSSSSFNIDTGILPPGVLYISKNYVVFEKPPSYQNIFIIPKIVNDISSQSQEDPVVYRLPIPWQVYIVQYSSNYDEYYTTNVRMHFMNSSLLSNDQQIFMAPLTNLYTSGELCRPMYSSMEDIDRYPKNILGVINSAYDWIWNSGTNLDLTASIVSAFNQLKAQPQNTIIQNMSPDIISTCSYTYPIETYYCSFSLVNKMYSSWEQIPLDEVSSLNWPTNSINKQLIDDLRIARENHYNSYISQNNIHQDECCEECAYYDDENNEYSNRDDCDCSCHQNLNTNNMEDFYNYANVWPPSPLTYLQSFTNFIKESSFYETNNLPYLNSGYTSMIDSIILSA